jgi:uncharacterized membrane protein YkvA (DUF1232 family)
MAEPSTRQQRERIERWFRHWEAELPEGLRELWEEIRLLWHLLQDLWHGRYHGVPPSTVAAIVAALFYLATPLDLIPDTIPLLGFTDDLLVLKALLGSLGDELERYRHWQEKQQELG